MNELQVEENDEMNELQVEENDVHFLTKPTDITDITDNYRKLNIKKLREIIIEKKLLSTTSNILKYSKYQLLKLLEVE